MVKDKVVKPKRTYTKRKTTEKKPKKLAVVNHECCKPGFFKRFFGWFKKFDVLAFVWK